MSRWLTGLAIFVASLAIYFLLVFRLSEAHQALSAALERADRLKVALDACLGRH